jgi:hypothetical protein
VFLPSHAIVSQKLKYIYGDITGIRLLSGMDAF